MRNNCPFSWPVLLNYYLKQNVGFYRRLPRRARGAQVGPALRIRKDQDDGLSDFRATW